VSVMRPVRTVIQRTQTLLTQQKMRERRGAISENGVGEVHVEFYEEEMEMRDIRICPNRPIRQIRRSHSSLGRLHQDPELIQRDFHADWNPHAPSRKPCEDRAHNPLPPTTHPNPPPPRHISRQPTPLIHGPQHRIADTALRIHAPTKYMRGDWAV
jgi:hypothetical protein